MINGPSTAHYDVDLGPVTIQDWYHTPTSQQASLVPPPVADSGLINGTVMTPDGQGKYFNASLQKGKRYRLRLINTSLENYFKVHLDNHVLTVIASDFVPITPYETDWLFISIGSDVPLFPNFCYYKWRDSSQDFNLILIHRSEIRCRHRGESRNQQLLVSSRSTARLRPECHEREYQGYIQI